jgi:hypothetical protein
MHHEDNLARSGKKYSQSTILNRLSADFAAGASEEKGLDVRL